MTKDAQNNINGILIDFRKPTVPTHRGLEDFCKQQHLNVREVTRTSISEHSEADLKFFAARYECTMLVHKKHESQKMKDRKDRRSYVLLDKIVIAFVRSFKTFVYFFLELMSYL